MGTELLDGIRVLDLSRVVAGPSCTRTLVELGAEVIKVEPPEGDLTRRGQPRVGGIAIYFAQQNCGKRCISLDLATDEGVALALELAATSDVLVENFRPGVLDRLGLGYEAVTAVQPSIVFCSITGYGQDGPAAQRRAYAPVVHAEVGLVDWVARQRDGVPRPEPISHADFAAGSQAATAIAAALFRRERTGEGAHIDVSMAETVLATNEWTAIEAAGGIGDRVSVFNPGRAAIVTVGDGTHVQLPGNPATNFPAHCRVMGRSDLLEDPRFADVASRDANHEAVVALMKEFALDFADIDAYEAALGAERIPVGAVRSLRDIPTEDWAVAREAYREIDDRDGGTVLLPRSPIRVADADTGIRGVARHQGEDNREVVGGLLGRNESELDRLEADGVLRTRPTR